MIWPNTVSWLDPSSETVRVARQPEPQPPGHHGDSRAVGICGLAGYASRQNSSCSVFEMNAEVPSRSDCWNFL